MQPTTPTTLTADTDAMSSSDWTLVVERSADYAAWQHDVAGGYTLSAFSNFLDLGPQPSDWSLAVTHQATYLDWQHEVAGGYTLRSFNDWRLHLEQ